MAAKRKSSKRSWKSQLFLVVGIIMGVIFLPSTFLLMVGMAPTPVAAFVDRSRKGSKVITVGAMNLAGCSPFLFDLWLKGNDFESSMAIALNPKAIIVMYAAAGVGYILDWALTGLVAGVMVQRGESRATTIREERAKLVERWGEKVTGSLVLDPQGFPVDIPGGAEPKEDEEDHAE
ncbi:MAG TPA: hypothetical protein PLO23_03015 [Alphaproteobacteria bacterium]|nr:hypothetical protein [Alphaproteobacteria bacterium]